jgi:hypothetical protein
MKPLPEKIVGGEASTQEVLNFITDKFNTLIDHLTDYEAEQDRRLTELDNRIQRIANNQLEMSRDFKARLLELGKEI